MNTQEYTDEELEEQYYEQLEAAERERQQAELDYAMEHEGEALDCDY
jgi:hypothetical protein